MSNERDAKLDEYEAIIRAFPAEVMWGDPLTPEVAKAFYRAGALSHAASAEPPMETELIEETANEFPIELRERAREAMRNAWVGGYNERVDHPPAQPQGYVERRWAEHYAKVAALSQPQQE